MRHTVVFVVILSSIKNVLNYPLKLVTLTTENTNLFLSFGLSIVIVTYANAIMADIFIVVLFAVLTFTANVLGHHPFLKIQVIMNTHSLCYLDQTHPLVMHVACRGKILRCSLF